MNRRGHTLTEMIVGTVVFSAFMTVGTDFLVQALRSTSAGELRGTALDQSSTIMYRLSDELRNESNILDPNQNVLRTQGAPYLVFQSQNETIAYRISNTAMVQRFLYEPGYPANQTVVPGSTRDLTNVPSTLHFWLGSQVSDAQTVEVALTVAPPNAVPITMRTKKTPFLASLLGL